MICVHRVQFPLDAGWDTESASAHLAARGYKRILRWERGRKWLTAVLRPGAMFIRGTWMLVHDGDTVSTVGMVGGAAS